MTGNIVVMPGSGQLDFQALQTVAAEFGWEVKVVSDLHEAAAAPGGWKTTAVLFHHDALGPACSWIDAVRLLRSAVPEACLVACHDFSESIDWPELCDAGAFHAIAFPLKANEVRQSLGFISEAEKRLELHPPFTAR
jgi:hypothetical protein